MDNKTRIILLKKHRENPTLNHTNLMRWLKNKYKIKVGRSTVTENLAKAIDLVRNNDLKPNQKRNKLPKYPIIEELLIEWIEEVEAIIPLSIKIIQEKAIEIFKELYLNIDNNTQTLTQSNLIYTLLLLNIKFFIIDNNFIINQESEFSASLGWFNNFKKRYGLKKFRRYGESGSVPIDLVSCEINKINAITRQYNAEDIFNIDESALFYKSQVIYLIIIEFHIFILDSLIILKNSINYYNINYYLG
jgi:hypothetical protein